MRNKWKHLFFLGIFVSILMVCGGTYVFADYSSDVRLNMNGTPVSTDVAPIIKDDRVLVPARAVFEALGGKVGWDSVNRVVTVAYGDTTVLLTIDSTTATVNGANHTLDVPAQIVNNRTLIPGRFVSESLAFQVDWDNSTRTVSITADSLGDITSPTINSIGEITNISVDAGNSIGSNTIVTITSNISLESVAYTYSNLSGPERFAIDFPGIKTTTANDASYSKPDSSVTAVRTGQLDTETGRIVVDLKESVTPVVALSSDKKTLTLTFRRLSTYFNPKEDGKIVVMLDPGHGAETGGKRSPDSSLMEYEFNRAVANKIKTLLEARGIEVRLTVNDNTDLSLAERCALVNDSNDVDIFVSIHANAYGNGKEWTTPEGWEIYHYAPDTLGKQLAQAIHDATIPTSGLKDRGVKSNDFYVIKNTYIPAVLIEHGFYTNTQEVEKLKSDEFRSMLAEYDARGILSFLGMAW